MALEIVDYFNAIRTAQHQVASQLGANVDMFPQETRILNDTLAASLAVVVKTLVDAGTGPVTDAALGANLAAVTSFDWTQVQL